MFFLIHCTEKQRSSSIIDEEFYRFYDQFQSDSTFQIDHIIFPLPGHPGNIGKQDSAFDISQFSWKKEDWILMKPLVDSSGFENGLSTFSNKIIIEKIVHKSGKYFIERRFVKDGYGWNLIYYQAMTTLEEQF